MCGICGFCGFHDDSVIRQMTERLNHRGPDDRGHFSDDKITLGHTRLSIIDLSVRGKQPLSNEDGTVWITYNGEIYNFEQIHEQLVGHHTFVSHTDTEVLVHAYEEYGIDFLNILRGMFAFALYDQKKEQLILVRDPIGKKPLYYFKNEKYFVFASEIKALLVAFSSLKIPVVVSDSALCNYLKNQYVPGSQTLIQRVYRLPPATYLTLNLKNSECTLHTYWTIQESIGNFSEEYYSKRLLKLLTESIRVRMMAADVPIGAFLSGGIDSSGITALARPMAWYEFHTFTAGFNDGNPDCEYARRVSETLSTTHHDVQINVSDVIRDFDRITWYFDEPLGDAAIIANYYLSREAKKYVKVVLAGEGSDELFGGYSSYKAGLKYQKWFALPKLPRRMFNTMISAIPWSGNPTWNRSCVYGHYIGQDSLEMAQQYSWQITGITSDEMRWLGNSDCTRRKTPLYIPKGIHDPLNRLLAYDCRNHLPDIYLMKADKATMANSIEERVPILDKELITFAFTIPTPLKIHGTIEKYIWRKTLQDLVPQEILNRPKKGFGVPYRSWITGEMRDIAIQTLGEGTFCKRIVAPQKMTKLLSSMKMSDSNRSSLLVWNLFALERWAKVFSL